MDAPADDERIAAHRLARQLILSGYDEAQARDLMATNWMIRLSTSKMVQCGRQSNWFWTWATRAKPPPHELVHIGVKAANHNVVRPLPADIRASWVALAAAIASVPPSDQGYISLKLVGVQLDEQLSSLLLRSLGAAPLKDLLLLDGAIPSFAKSILQMNGSVEVLAIKSHAIEEHDAISLIETVNSHARLGVLLMRECGIGLSHSVMSAIVPSFNHMKCVDLESNHIGTLGATLISASLAENPCIEYLGLQNNLLTDQCAAMIARSLETNTNLRLLKLRRNQFSWGIDVLLLAVCNLSSLERLQTSNHTCKIDVSSDERHDWVNSHEDANRNRVVKFLGVLTPKSMDYSNMELLEGFPTECIPELLAFMQQGASKWDIVYRLLGEFCVPRLEEVAERTRMSTSNLTTSDDIPALEVDEKGDNVNDGTVAQTMALKFVQVASGILLIFSLGSLWSMWKDY